MRAIQLGTFARPRRSQTPLSLTVPALHILCPPGPPALSPAGGRAGACHPRPRRPFPAHPICRAARALRCVGSRGGGWAERKQPELGEAGDALPWMESSPLPPRRAPLLSFLGGLAERRRDSRPASAKEAQSSPLLVGQALRGFPQRWLQFALVPPLLPLLLLPFVLLPLPVAAAGFLGGAMRLASKGWFCSERKVLPALAGASLLLSPGASPSLGCAKRPLMMEAPGWYFPRPFKSS